MSAKNYNAGKERPSLILKDMSSAFTELVKGREAGIAKGYARMNWAESIGTDDAPRFLDENVDSIFRHLIAYMSGETHDPESGCHHMAHVMCRAGFAIQYTEAEVVQPKTANPCPHDSITENVCDDCQGYINPVKTRYPWRDAPDWAMWGATDLSGDFCWYEDEPQHGCTEWLKLSGEHELIKSNAPACLDWKETLEARTK
jgi:hypothetical protein